MRAEEKPAKLTHSPELRVALDQAIERTVKDFAPAKLAKEDIATTVIDLSDPASPRLASHRGEVGIYPASVIKLFYLVAAHQWMKDGRVHDTPELRRAMRDMIVDSGNEATHYVMDLLTGTTSGPELPEEELRLWQDKRNAITRHFAALGYQGVHAHRKPWYEGPYGREKQAAEKFPPSSNQLTTDATAQLFHAIATHAAVSAKASDDMLALLSRDLAAPVIDPEDQTNGFTGIAVREIPGAKLWSKAGWTSQTRHDAALVELPNGRRLIIVTFTVGHSKERGIIPSVARGLLGIRP